MSASAAVQTQTAKPTLTRIASGMLQRQCACGRHTSAGGECEECKKKREGTLQRAAINPSQVKEVPPIVHEVLRSPGQPLDAATRAFMEPRFGHDFSHVLTNTAPHFAKVGLTVGPTSDPHEEEARRIAEAVVRAPEPVAHTQSIFRALPDFSKMRVHRGTLATEASRTVNARAFTVGHDIVFGDGAYQPSISEGQRLLAHELTHVVQQVGAVGGTLLRRDVVNDAAGNPVSFEFRVGIDLTQPFVELAKNLAGDSAISDNDLRMLRKHALDRRGTVDDHERLFMAGLLDPPNVRTLRRTAIGARTSITFPIASLSNARLQRVIDLDRKALPAAVTTPLRESQAAMRDLRIGDMFTRLGEAETAASAEITARAGAFRAQAAALVAFAHSKSLSLSSVLRAMLAAASDNSDGDRVLAGTTYAIAAAAGHPLESDLLGGRIKVDALIPRAFARLPGIDPNLVAFYVTAAQGSGMKGDTLYLKTDIDIANLRDRSTVIHELEHAQQDKAASPTARPGFPVKNRLELRAYRAQGRYILDQIASQRPAEQARSAAQILTPLNGLVLGGILLEGQTNPALYQPLLEMVFGAAPAPFHRAPADVGRLLRVTPATIEAALLRDIDTGYNLAPGATGVTEGLAGESIIHWIYRL